MLNTYREEIRESRWNPTFIGYADKLGENNIDDLNRVFHQATTYFPKYQTVQAAFSKLENDFQDESVNYLRELITRVDEIYQNIKTFNNNPKQYIKTPKKGAQ